MVVEKCFLCEEDLKWVGYGDCNHKEGCSTCIVRNRYLLQDLRCFKCKNPIHTANVTEPSIDLASLWWKEGQVGPFWYHENSKALFTDFDEYTRIREMCKLVCNACKKTDFKCIGELMTHLYERHELYMCTACLLFGSRFVCEQKLFTKEQLNQHIRTGDSEVDGDVTERKGFTGHPKCDLCVNPFYGDEEVFVHISAACKCHICYKLRPGIKHNDVEDHFRKEHIDAGDGYWLATFPIVRAFANEQHLNDHINKVHAPPAAAVQNRVTPSSSSSEKRAFGEKILDRLSKSLKNTSRYYRCGLIDAKTYVKYLNDHGLSDLVLDIASFFPDSAIRRELIEAYTASLREGDDIVEEDSNTSDSPKADDIVEEDSNTSESPKADDTN